MTATRAVCAAFATALGLALASCSVVTPADGLPALSSFGVEARGVYLRTNLPDGGFDRLPLPVSASCEARYADAGGVPADAKGTAACRYLIPRGQIDIDIAATALNVLGKKLPGFTGPVSFKVLPGQLSASPASRWAQMERGALETTIQSIHQYGEVRVWVSDSPPEVLYADGGIVAADKYPEEPAERTHASGVTPPIWFEDQTLQSLQTPDGADNRSSPFVGEFVSVGRNPESGSVLQQTCAADPARNGVQSLMVVTGIDPTGFFVTDITACRLPETTNPRTFEPREPCYATLDDGTQVPITQTAQTSGTCAISKKTCTRTGSGCTSYLPGTFGSMFIYNFNFPDGLNQGDLLFTVSGSIQEFTSTTQIVFPGWTIAERVRLLPPDQWNKWLAFAPPVDLTGRTCGLDNAGGTPFVTDVLCGMSSSNLKLESLESALVRVRGIALPTRFVNCDFNGDGSLPCFSNRTVSFEGNSTAIWSNCDFNVPPGIESENDIRERTCVQDCTLSRNAQGQEGLCTERSTFVGFGQYAVEMAPFGPSYANLDSSLPTRIANLAATTSATARFVDIEINTARGYEAGAVVAFTCDTDVRYAVGSNTVEVAGDSPLLPAKQVFKTRLQAGQTAVGFRAVSQAGTCSASINPRMRINLVTKDAIPELNVECSVDDPNVNRAQQCRNLRAATFDVVGHLRQVQAARPRWVVTPRDPDDMCCYPGPGLSCPTPIKPCVAQ